MNNNRYHTGWVYEGSLFGEEPSCYEEWAVAADSLIELMKQMSEDDDANALGSVNWESVEDQFAWFESDEAPAMAATVASILKDDPPHEGKNFSAVVEDHELRRLRFYLLGLVCENPAHIEADDE
jgi:hypothetical protein